MARYYLSFLHANHDIHHSEARVSSKLHCIPQKNYLSDVTVESMKKALGEMALMSQRMGLLEAIFCFELRIKL